MHVSLKSMKVKSHVDNVLKTVGTSEIQRLVIAGRLLKEYEQ